MDRTKRILVQAILGSFVVGSWLVAQTTAPVEQRSFQFCVFGQPVPDGSIVYQSEPGVISTLAFRPYQRSDDMNYTGPQTITFAKKRESAQGEPTYEVLARVEVASTISKPLFVFTPNVGGANGLTVGVVDDAPDRFSKGSVIVVNQSGFDLEGLVGGKSAKFAIGAQRPFHAGGSLLVQLALQHHGKLVPAFDQKLSLERTERAVLLLLPPARPSSPLVRWTLLIDEPFNADDAPKK